jgi:aryl-alcohol dehydrogenase-like predicted oxidoreductase
VQTHPRDLNASRSQLALAWVLARAGEVIPIPSTRRLSHLQDNLKTTQPQLSQANLAGHRRGRPAASVQGDDIPSIT